MTNSVVGTFRTKRNAMVRFVIPGLELEEQQEREESWAPEERGVIKCPLTSARAGNPH